MQLRSYHCRSCVPFDQALFSGRHAAHTPNSSFVLSREYPIIPDSRVLPLHLLCEWSPPSSVVPRFLLVGLQLELFEGSLLARHCVPASLQGWPSGRRPDHDRGMETPRRDHPMPPLCCSTPCTRLDIGP